MTKISRKRKTTRLGVFSHPDGVWMIESGSCILLGNMETKSSTHQPSVPDFRVGVGWEVGVWAIYSPNGQGKNWFTHSFHSFIHLLTHSTFIYLFSRHGVKNGRTQWQRHQLCLGGADSPRRGGWQISDRIDPLWRKIKLF